MYPDRCTIIFRTLGIWGLPPDFVCLEYIKNLICVNKIDTVIDYGAGMGLWSKILSDYLNMPEINVIAYDIKSPVDNNEINRQKGMYFVTKEIELEKYINSLLMLVWPTRMSRMAEIALEKFKGSYVLYYGDLSKTLKIEYYTGNDRFHEMLKTNWDMIQVIEPLNVLMDENGEYKDKIYMFKRKCMDIILNDADLKVLQSAHAQVLSEQKI